MRILAITTVTLTVAVAGCSKSSISVADGKRANQESPKAVFTAYTHAHKKRDWKAVYDLYSPDSRLQMIQLLAIHGSLGDKEGKMAKIFEKYIDKDKAKKLFKSKEPQKLSPKERERVFAASIRNEKKMFVELNQRLDELGTDRPVLSDLRAVEIKGDKAKGLATSTSIHKWEEAKTGGPSIRHREKRSHESSVFFVRIKSKWLIATEDEWKAAK